MRTPAETSMMPSSELPRPVTSSTDNRTKKHVLALLGILAFAAVIRFTGIDYLLPCNAEPDKHLISQARQLREDRPPYYPAYGAYPHFLATVLSLLPAKEKLPVGASLEEHLQACGDRFLQGRQLMSLLGVATVLLTYFLARRFHGPGPSLFAAGLLASSLLHTLYSNQARPHVGAALLTNLALLAAIHLAARPSPRTFWLASLSFLLAFCSLQTAVFTLPPIAVGVWCFLFRQGRSGTKAPSWILGPWPHVLLALLVGALAVWQFYPFLFAATGGDSATTPIGSLKFPHHFSLSRFNFTGSSSVLKHLWQHDPVLVVTAALAIRPVLRRLLARRPRGTSPTTLMLAFVVPYLAVLCIWSNTWARLLLPLLPALCILSAASLAVVANLLSRVVSNQRLSKALATLIIFAVPVSTLVRYVQLKVRRDSLASCAAWLEKNVGDESGAIALTPWLSLPVFRHITAGERVGDSGLRLPWVKYQAHLDEQYAPSNVYPLVPLHRNGQWPKHIKEITTATEHAKILASIDPAYVVLSLRPGTPWRMEPAVEQWGEPVASFGGSQDHGLSTPPHWPYQCDNTFLRLWEASQFGPALQVFAPKAPTVSPAPK